MNTEEAYQELKEIKAIMDRSTRFLSLSGWSGVLVGIYALIGSGVAWGLIYDFDPYFTRKMVYVPRTTLILLFVDALIVLLASIITALALTYQRTRAASRIIWTGSAMRLIIDLSTPLIFGGLFLALLLFHGFVGVVAPGMLLFYGLGLFAASRNTYSDIRVLGIAEMILGLVALFDYGHGLFYWAIGFGIFHIAYGLWMYFRYEVNKL